MRLPLWYETDVYAVAGIAAALCADGGKDVRTIDGTTVRKTPEEA